MASEIDIVNLALAHLGDEANVVSINPSDGSAQSALAGRFYPMARDVLLEMQPWIFATFRSTLAVVANPLDEEWGYAYALPANCLRPLESYMPGMARTLDNTAANGWRYSMESSESGSGVLYTNAETAELRYIKRIEDTTKFTPMFTSALARLLASYLAGPILKGTEGMRVAQAQLKLFSEIEYRQAAAHNANSNKRGSYLTTPAWFAGRMPAGLGTDLPR